MGRLIDADALEREGWSLYRNYQQDKNTMVYESKSIAEIPTAQPERLTDDDFETIRIHLSAYKEKLCNQRRWKEAEEYQRIIDRFMSFSSAQPSYTDEQVQKMQDLEQAEIEKAFQLGREDAQSEIIMCKDCRWGREACGNIECFADLNAPTEYHGYEWFCPNGERRTDGRENQD